MQLLLGLLFGLICQVSSYSYFSCSKSGGIHHSNCSGFPRNAGFLNGFVYHTWNWPSDRGASYDPAYSLNRQSRVQNSNILDSYTSTFPMAVVEQNETFTVLWTRVDANDGTIEGTQRVWIYCDSQSPNRNLNTAQGSDSFQIDGGLEDFQPGLWHNSHDQPGPSHPYRNYTMLGYYSFCQSTTGDPNDLIEANCQCLQADTGSANRGVINVDYQNQCAGNLTIPASWGEGIFTCAWFYQIDKSGYFNRYSFVFEVNVGNITVNFTAGAIGSSSSSTGSLTSSSSSTSSITSSSSLSTSGSSSLSSSSSGQSGASSVSSSVSVSILCLLYLFLFFFSVHVR